MNTNHQRVGVALDLLSKGLFPFFEQALKDVHGDRWEEAARSACRSQANLSAEVFNWDAQAILTVMWNLWNLVFSRSLGMIERSLVSELREFRNRWAHQTSFNDDDAYRVLDSVQRLLNACDAPTFAVQVEEQKLDLLREKLGRRVNEELARVRFNRARVIDSSLYALCAVAISFTMFAVWGGRHPMVTGLMMGFTAFVFAYFIYKRCQQTPPAYGVHECDKCGKVVYSEICPYCEPAPHAERNAPGNSASNSKPTRSDRAFGSNRFRVVASQPTAVENDVLVEP